MKLFKGLALAGLAQADKVIDCHQLNTVHSGEVAKWWDSDHYKYRYAIYYSTKYFRSYFPILIRHTLALVSISISQHGRILLSYSFLKANRVFWSTQSTRSRK